MSKKQNYINNSECSLLDSISSFKKDMSKKTIKNYIKNRMVMVNDKAITNSSYIVNDGDEITINYSSETIKSFLIVSLYNILKKENSIKSMENSTNNQEEFNSVDAMVTLIHPKMKQLIRHILI